MSPAAQALRSINRILEMYTDGITVQGVTRRINFHALYEFLDPETQATTREWHYFGSTAAAKPPTTADTVFEHARIQIPDDLNYLPHGESDQDLYNLGIKCGQYREGIVEAA